MEFINRIIVYKTPDIIAVIGILYLIKGTTLEDTSSSCKNPKKSNVDDQRSRKHSTQEQLQELGLFNLKKT